MPPRLALDAHGSDAHPDPEIAGALSVVEETGTPVILVGDRARLEAEVKKLRPSPPAGLSFVHAPEVIAMDDEPGRAVRKKKDASMVRTFDLVKRGEADAAVTMGNSGAAMMLGTLTLGRLAGVARPAIVNHIPNLKGTAVMLDGGANVDCKPEWLVQFAVMGSIYARAVLGVADPQVGLIANGTEESKGNEVVQAAHALLKATSGIRYVGLREPMDIFEGNIDVGVVDGFSGNLILKTIEGVVEAVFGLLKREIKARPIAIAGAYLAKGAFKAVKAKADYDEHGGAPLLGVGGAALIGHGRSTPKAIKSALLAARRLVESGANAQIMKQLEVMPEAKENVK